MSAAAGIYDEARVSRIDRVLALVRRNSWGFGLIAFLALLVIFTRLIQPTYGPAELQNLAINVLPLAFAAAAQAVIVISGGIDLSIGSTMALTSVIGAVAMKGQTEEVGIAIVIGVLLLGLLIGAVNGALIVLTRVPDIIVTLAMSFVWAGVALLVLSTPGGASTRWLRDLVLGSLGSEWIPKAALVLLVVVAVIWLPILGSRIGLSFYAVGSNQLAAFRSGVSVGRTKFLSYAVGGLFAALGGISLTASTGLATPVPGPYTLLSVAAVVLGGVSLAGGRGGLFGPIVAVVILSLMRTDMTLLGVNPNMATVAQGVILIGVVMLGTLIQIRSMRGR